MGAVAEGKVLENASPDPATGPGGDLDRKIRPSVSRIPQGPKGRKTKGQGPPLALLIAC